MKERSPNHWTTREFPEKPCYWVVRRIKQGNAREALGTALGLILSFTIIIVGIVEHRQLL